MFTYVWNDLLCHILIDIMCMSPHCCVYIVPPHEGFILIYIDCDSSLGGLLYRLTPREEFTFIYRLWLLGRVLPPFIDYDSSCRFYISRLCNISSYSFNYSINICPVWERFFFVQNRHHNATSSRMFVTNVQHRMQI